MSTLAKRILLGLLGVFLVMQFFRINKTNPPVDDSKDFLKRTNAPVQVTQLISTACYDCHSHQTNYPWYTNVAPVSWWIKNHIDEGREHLNFSTWMDYDLKKRDHKLEECIEEVEEGKMPLDSYTWLHKGAKLDEAQKTMLVTWFSSVRNKSRERIRKKKLPLMPRSKTEKK